MTRRTLPRKTPFISPKRQFSPSKIRVRQSTMQAMRRLASDASADPRQDYDWFCRQAARASRAIPAPLADQLQAFADEGSGVGFLVVQGLDVGEIPATPLDNRGGLGASTLLARQMAIIAHSIGDMIAYQAEGHGHLIQDTVPNPDLAFTQQSQGSRAELEAHTEQCFSCLRPDYIVLGCLRGDAAALTYVLDARTLVQHLSQDEHDMLRRPLWTTRVDPSFTEHVPDPDELRGPFPILSGPEHDPAILIDQDLMWGISQEAQDLLQKVIALYIEHRRAHCLQPGEVLLLDNARAMHGRSVFEPRFDGTDRFIVRGFIVRDRRSRLPYMAPDRRTLLAKHS